MFNSLVMNDPHENTVGDNESEDNTNEVKQDNLEAAKVQELRSKTKRKK
jgi:hypothetical protein